MNPPAPKLSMKLFEAVCRSSPDVIVIASESGTILFVSDHCRNLLGYEAAELLGMSVETLVPNEIEHHQQMRAGYNSEPKRRPMGSRPFLRAVHKSGVEVPVDISLSPIPPIDGHTGGLVQAVMRDAGPRWTLQKEMLVQSVAMDAAANGIVITDRSGTIRWVNPAVTRITGYGSDELIGAHTRIFKSGLHDEAFYDGLWQTISAGRPWFGSMANRRKNGSIYYEEQHIAPVRGDTGEITHFIAIKQDVTERLRAERELEERNRELQQRVVEIEGLHRQLVEQAIRDPLTNLFNRRYLDEMLEREVARAIRYQTPLSAVLLDVDHFKDVNDLAGHAAGDAILVGLAGLLKSMFRAVDIICRYGGDEFVVVLPGAALHDAVRRAEDVRTAFATLRATVDSAAIVPPCSLSLGVAQFRTGEESAQALIERADQALYEAKHLGRNRTVPAGETP
ncbi:MAG: diguanylate cyclase [Myxococcales bacterium]|nr:diguanylate cyclase [Myxococcales bacterium]